MAKQSKYLSWGNFLKSKREISFRSARDFCAQVPVGISYPQYSRYESGEQIPSLGQAISICATFGIPPLETLLEWNLAQLTSEDSIARSGVLKLLEDFRGKVPGESSASGWPTKAVERSVPLDDLIVFNRSHLKVFASDPAYRDVFTYINSFGPNWITAAEIAQALDLSLERVIEMVEKLSDLGVTLVSPEGCRSAKRNFYFPDDEDFFGLRNANFEHNSRSILKNLKHADLLNRNAFRGLVTRELTEDQMGLMLKCLEQLTSQIISMPETGEPRTIYSLCVLLGERFSRASVETL